MNALSIGHVSTFPPTQCGIATYAEALAASLENCNSFEIPIVFSSDSGAGEFTKLELNLRSSAPLRNVHADLGARINSSGYDVISLQHEFGIFGGDDGEYVIDLLSEIRKPVVTTLHTVSPGLSSRRIEILRKIVELSASVVVLSPEDLEVLAVIAPCSKGKVDVIRHGVPDHGFLFPEESEFRRTLQADFVFVSSGHVRPSKGYHLALEALALFKKEDTNFKYVILGEVQPQYDYGEQYRNDLRGLIEELDLTANVIWYEQYLQWPELIEKIAASDIGLLTYIDREQASSGVLPLMLALGRPVIATTFAYAERFAKEASAIRLAGWNDPSEISDAILNLTKDQRELQRSMRRAYDHMRPFVWRRIGEAYERAFFRSKGAK